MKQLLIITVWLAILTFPVPTQAVLFNLTPDQIQTAEEFAAEHKEKTGLVLNNQYSIGKNEIFSERVIIRSKWHKFAQMIAMKNQKNEKMTEKERADILNDPFLQIDIILFGHSLDFAKDYRVKLSQPEKEISPEKIHADHFEIAAHKGGHYSGFPAYRATIRTYFSYSRLCADCRLDLIIAKDGHKHKIQLDMSNYK